MMSEDRCLTNLLNFKYHPEIMCHPYETASLVNVFQNSVFKRKPLYFRYIFISPSRSCGVLKFRMTEKRCFSQERNPTFGNNTKLHSVYFATNFHKSLKNYKEQKREEKVTPYQRRRTRQERGGHLNEAVDQKAGFPWLSNRRNASA